MCEFFEISNECETIPFGVESQTSLEVRRLILLPSSALTLWQEPNGEEATGSRFPSPRGNRPGVPSFERIH